MTDTPPEEAKIDIHKPKPWHNWREFLKELGTIALGVGVALAAEQAVEWWHWRGKTAYAVEQIQRELATDIYYSEERVLIADCIAQRLDLLEHRLLTGGENAMPVVPAAGRQAENVVPMPIRPWYSFAWNAATADTSVTHFNRDRLSLYAGIYSSMELNRGDNQREFAEVSRLNILSKPVTLSADKRVEMLEIIEKERNANRLMARVTLRLREKWKQIGLDPVQAGKQVVSSSPSYAACRAPETR